MYSYIDESGHTGSNLFDPNQPTLYYGILSSKTNLDVTAEPLLKKLRSKLDVERLHATELGVARLSEVAPHIKKFCASRDIRFSMVRVQKPDHAIMSFFDQVFDAGINKAVSWSHYWTPLRFVSLHKVAYLFDEGLAKMAWKARQERNPAKCAAQLKELCALLLRRVGRLPDERSRDIISGALHWASENPFEIDYGVSNKDSALQISPNLIGFQSVMFMLATMSDKQSRKIRSIVVDRQTEFNRAQGELADIYVRMRGNDLAIGPGMPSFDMSKMPEVPPTFTAGDESAGLELVDGVLWVAKRRIEEKPLSAELNEMLRVLGKRGLANEVSLQANMDRWAHLAELPEPSASEAERAKKIIDAEEVIRLKALEGIF
ncbi:DUF3800 domain-containing protein [Roseovarius sp. ZX-A-9]|uniref:DUF3800 domain-containing protein n=1 Tax=Roseovarius sp. ZX-A-9 TaxID=3014783 RepID=UPI002330F5F0|nr:DUF3800 domain-containing protein [Roseovarius sp. ZX-A-9]